MREDEPAAALAVGWWGGPVVVRTGLSLLCHVHAACVVGSWERCTANT